MLPLPDAEYLRDLFDYDPETGRLTWRRPRQGVSAGSLAGSVNSHGYRQVRIDRRLYKAHRIIWKIVTGQDPLLEIDHRNRDRTDNRWSNLRVATRSENAINRDRITRSVSSPFRGVSYNRRDRRWQARIQRGGRSRSLGYFTSPEEAHSARQACLATSSVNLEEGTTQEAALSA